MEFRYHSKTFELLGISPIYSPKNLEQIIDFEVENNIILPPSLKEWYSIENHQHILQELVDRTLNHSVLAFEESYTFGDALEWLLLDEKYFYVLAENQGVYHMAVEVIDEEDPPVFVRYYEPNETWALHAKTFSDWVYAIAWDGMNWQNVRLSDEYPQLSAFLAESTEVGPETYHVNMWLRAPRFRRGLYNGQRLIVYDPLVDPSQE